jgi:hypothetical protein
MLVEYRVGYVLAIYQKMLKQWFGDKFETTLPNNALDFLEKHIKRGMVAKNWIKENAPKITGKNYTEQSSVCGENEHANKDTCASGSVPQAETESRH